MLALPPPPPAPAPQSFAAPAPLHDAILLHHDLAVADLDHDGRSEWVTATSGVGDVRVFGFESTQTYARPQILGRDLPYTWQVDTTDLDADGWADLVTLALDPDPAIDRSVYAYPSDRGAFSDATRVRLLPDTGIAPLVLGDVDNDGDPDLLSRNAAGHILLHFTAGFTLDPTPIDLGPGTFAEDALRDVDGDGLLDLILEQGHVRPGLGGGAFGQAIDFFPGLPGGPEVLGLADIDLDGQLEAIRTGGLICALHEQVAPFTFEQTGTVIHNDVPSVFFPQAADLNDDGLVEIVLRCCQGDHNAANLFQTAPGVWQMTSLNLGFGFDTKTLGDVNGDGHTDVLIDNNWRDGPLSIGFGDGSSQPIFTPHVSADFPLYNPVVHGTADFDEDGDIDILAGRGYAGS